MIRRFNYTDRKKIERKDIVLKLFVPTGGFARVTASISLEEYSLPSDASVALEAYRQNNWMRFETGTVDDLWNTGPHLLSEFSDPDAVLFRVRVTAPSAEGRLILAEADQIPWSVDDDSTGTKSPLLVPKGEEIGDELWQLDLSGEMPLLLVNKSFGDWRLTARKPEFMYSVYPNVFRIILRAILLDDDETAYDSDDLESWQGRLLRMSENMPGVSQLHESSTVVDKEVWIEKVVQVFCRTNRFRQRFSKCFEDEES